MCKVIDSAVSSGTVLLICTDDGVNMGAKTLRIHADGSGVFETDCFGFENLTNCFSGDKSVSKNIALVISGIVPEKFLKAGNTVELR